MRADHESHGPDPVKDTVARFSRFSNFKPVFTQLIHNPLDLRDGRVFSTLRNLRNLVYDFLDSGHLYLVGMSHCSYHRAFIATFLYSSLTLLKMISHVVSQGVKICDRACYEICTSGFTLCTGRYSSLSISAASGS